MAVTGYGHLFVQTATPAETPVMVGSVWSDKVGGLKVCTSISPFTFATVSGGGHTLTIGTHLTGTAFDGSADITIATDAVSTATAGTLVARDGSGNFAAGTITATLIGNVTGNLTGNASGSSGSCTGNAATATALATSRNINGAAFNGTADIALNLRASAYNSATQSIGDSTFVDLTFNSEDFDNASIHSTVSATERMTIPSGGDGVYLVIGQTAFATAAGGTRFLQLKKNGTTPFAQSSQAGNTINNQRQQVVAIISLVATDYVTLQAFQASGGNLSVGDTNRETASALQIVRLF